MRRFPLTGYLIKRSLPGDVEDGAVLSRRDAEAHELCHHVRKLCHHVTLKITSRKPSETSDLPTPSSSQKRAIRPGCDIQFGACLHMGGIQAGRSDLSCWLSSQGFIENRNQRIINELETW